MTSATPATEARPTGNTMTTAEAAARLGVSTNAMAIWRYYKRGPDYVKCGRSVTYDEDEVEAFRKANLHICTPDIRNLRRR